MPIRNSFNYQGSNIFLCEPKTISSGISANYSVPSKTKRITAMFKGVSTNGTSGVFVRMGGGYGIETTGYFTHLGVISTTPFYSSGTDTLGIYIAGGDATTVYHGQVILNLMNPISNTWTFSGMSFRDEAVNDAIQWTTGSKALLGELTTIQFCTRNGTDTFDSGEINISYEA